MTREHGTNVEHDLVEGRPPRRGDRWWARVARQLGSAARTMVDGADRLGGLVRGVGVRATEPARPAARHQLHELLLELQQHVRRYPSEGSSALAEDDEFWGLLGKIQRLHGRASRPRSRSPLPPVATEAPTPERRRPQPAPADAEAQRSAAQPPAAEPPAAASPPPELPAAVDPTTVLPAVEPAGDPEDFLQGVLDESRGVPGESDEPALDAAPVEASQTAESNPPRLKRH